MRGRYPAMMYEIYIFLIVLTIGMAKRPRKRSAPRDWTRIPINNEQTLGTLANITGVTESIIGSNFTHDVRVTSIDVLWTLDNFTAGEGPIAFGVAHGDYSLTEIEEFLEQAQPLGPASLIEREIAQRKIRRIGVFAGGNASETFNDGKPKKTRLNWLIPDGHTIDMWAYSYGGTANLTSGAVVRVLGQMNGFWT